MNLVGGIALLDGCGGGLGRRPRQSPEIAASLGPGVHEQVHGRDRNVDKNDQQQCLLEVVDDPLDRINIANRGEHHERQGQNRPEAKPDPCKALGPPRRREAVGHRAHLLGRVRNQI